MVTVDSGLPGGAIALDRHRLSRLTASSYSFILLLQKIKSSFELQFQLCAFGEIEFVAAAGFHQVRGEGPEGRAFRSFLFVFVFYAFYCADGRASSCRCSSVLLRAGAALNQAFLIRHGFYAVIAGDAHDFRDNGQVTKFGVKFVEGQPDLSAAGDPCSLDAADVSRNFRSRRQVKAAACFQWFERLYFERGVFLRALGAQFVFETHEEFGAGSHGKRDRKRHTSELQSHSDLVCRLLLEKKKK